MGLGDVGKGALNNCVKQNDNGHLDKERETSRHGVVAFLLLKLHDLLLLFLHCGLVCSTLVFSLDKLDLGGKLCHLDLVLLLLDGEGQEYDLEYQCVKEQCHCVVT